MTGLPNGQLQVKYYCDYELEAHISERLFPGKTSKVSEIGKMIEEYQEADDTFRELWLLFMVSTVVAPTTDTKMSNKCYPMLLDIADAKEMNMCKFIVDELHNHLSNGKYSRGCLLYCMLRYFNALNTSHLELMLGDERFAINAWSSLQIDAVGAIDAQEYDSTIFGALELKDEYKEDIAREMGLFGGPNGFEAWMNLNTHPSCKQKQMVKAFTLMQSFASGLNGLLSNLVQALTESGDTNTDNKDDVEQPNDEEDVDLSASESEEYQETSPTVVTRRVKLPTRRAGKGIVSDDIETPTQLHQEASMSSSPPPMHSQIAVPTYSDLDRSEAEGNIDSARFTPDSLSESTEQADERIRGSAAVLASSLGLMKKSNISSASESSMNNLVKNIVAKEFGIPVDIHEKESKPVELNKATTEQEHHGLETTLERERLHHQLDSSALNVAAGSKNIVSQDVSVPSEGLISQDVFVPLNVVVPQDVPILSKGVCVKVVPDVFVPLNVVVAQDVPVLSKGVCAEDVPVLSRGVVDQDVPVVSNVMDSSADENLGNDVVKDNRLKRRKRLALPTAVPPRKSPRLARKHDESIPECSDLIRKSRNGTNSSVGTKSATKEDGKSSSSAFVVVSPTVNTNYPELKQSTVGDGKTVSSAIPISPYATKSPAVNDGNSKDSVIPISPTVVDPQSPKPSAGINTCRSIVVSPAQQQHPHGPSDLSGSKWKLSPLVGAYLGGLGLGNHTPVRVSEDIRDAVRNISESVKKTGILSRIAGLERMTATRPLRKRKRVDKGSSSSGRKRYINPGMFTPPSFDLGLTSQETTTSGSQLDIISSEEDAVSDFALDVAPLSWSNPEAEPAGNTSSDVDFEEFTLSEEVQQVMAGNVSQLSERGVIELASFDCGFHALYNIEKWDGQNIPLLAKGDVAKLRRVTPHKWLTADFNEEKYNWIPSLFNNAIRSRSRGSVTGRRFEREEVPAAAIMAEEEIGHWVSKDHFAAKRLHALGADLDDPKRRIIAEQSAFRALLDVSPFNIPNALIDFVASHTSPGLREFKFHKKRIVFTKEMVRKVFGIRCGERLVVQKKGEHPEMRQMYIEEGQSRPFIQHAVKLLKNCDVTDDLTIIRTWDLICLATVIDPGSANLLSLDYLDCMLDPRRTHEFAWDEHLLELAMQEVTKINSKTAEAVLPGNARKHEFWITGPFALLVIVYMDHLDFPPNQHAINYSIPRVCFVTSKDFKFIVLNDADRKILNNKTVFGRRPFLDLSNTPYGVAAFVNHHVEQPVEEPEVNPSASLNEWLVFPSSQDLEFCYFTFYNLATIVNAAYKHLYEKHRTIFGGDVDTTLKKFGVGLKQMQSQRMAALLIDIDAAMKEGDGPSVHFPTGGGVEDETMDAADGHENEGTANQADEETEEADSEATENDEDVVEANATDMETHTLVVDMPQSAVLLDSSTGGADVGEQVVVNSPDPDEVVESDSLQHITTPAEEITPPTDVACVVKLDDASSEQPKDMEAATPPIPSKDAEADHLGENLSPQHPRNTDVVTKDASTGAKTVEKKTRYKRAAKGELSPPLLKKIKVYQDIVHKYDKYVAHARKFKRKKKNEEPKQFLKIGRFFCSYKSFHGALRPRQYMNNDVMAVWTEKFNHAAKASVEKNPRNHKKYAFSPYLVEKLVVETSTFDPATVMKEFKVACSKFKVLKDDMFSNFIRTANESKVSWVDFGKFKQITPDHPQQDTLFDCGFYSILYMEHFSGKVMPKFENDAIPDFRRVLAASLIDNRDNQSEDVDLIMNEDLQQG
ncbi:hypothetical protein ACQ4PT_030878 [Festuca glaucescens]